MQLWQNPAADESRVYGSGRRKALVLGDTCIIGRTPWTISELIVEDEEASTSFAGPPATPPGDFGLVACNTATGATEYFRIPQRPQGGGTVAFTYRAVPWSDGCVAVAALPEPPQAAGPSTPRMHPVWLWRPGSAPTCVCDNGALGEARHLISALDGAEFSIECVGRRTGNSQSVATIWDHAKFVRMQYALPSAAWMQGWGGPFRSAVLGSDGQSIVEHISEPAGGVAFRRRELQAGTPIRWTTTSSQLRQHIGRDFVSVSIPGQCTGPAAAVPLVIGDAIRADVWMLDAATGKVSGPIAFPGLAALLCPKCNRSATLLAHAGRAGGQGPLIIRVYDVRNAKYILDQAFDLEDVGRTRPVGFLPDDSLVLQTHRSLWKLEYPFGGKPKLVYRLEPADQEPAIGLPTFERETEDRAPSRSAGHRHDTKPNTGR